MAWPMAAAMIGANIVGGLLQNEQASSAAKKAADANQRMSREQMKFQERMSSSAHQRQAKDLKAAGFNPLLSATGGASSPAGAAGSMSPAPVENVLSSAVSSAVEARQLGLAIEKQGEEVKNLQASNQLTKAQTAKTIVDTDVARKGIPRSELTNDFFDLVRPLVKNLKNSFHESPKLGESDLAKKHRLERETSLKNMNKMLKNYQERQKP